MATSHIPDSPAVPIDPSCGQPDPLPSSLSANRDEERSIRKDLPTRSKADRISLFLIGLITAWTLIGAGILYNRGDAFEGTVGLISLLIYLFIQLMLPRLARMSNPAFMRNIVSFVMISSLSVGRYFYLYARVRHFDKSQHVLYGMVIVLFALLMLYRLTAVEKRLQLDLHPALIWLWLIGFAMFVLFVWEVFEYTGDRLFGSDMQDWKAGGISGLADTMIDLITGFIGAALVAALLVWRLTRDRARFYRRWIQGFFPVAARSDAPTVPQNAASGHASIQDGNPDMQPESSQPPARTVWFFAYILLALAIYTLTARVWQPFYLIKSFVKILLFVVIPLLYSRFYQKDLTWLRINGRKKSVRRGCLHMTLLGLILIASAFALARPIGQLVDVESIAAEILTRTRAPQLLVIGSLLYIPVFNAPTEEIFFRGYLLQKFAQRFSSAAASLLSAAVFAAYHLIVFRNWFNIPLLLAMLAGLMIAGLFLNYLTRKYDSLLPAWILHGLANISIFAVASPWFGF